MDTDSPFNIFDQAAKGPKKKPVPQQPPKPVAPPTPTPEALQTLGVADAIERMRAMQRDLQDKLDTIYDQARKAGMDPKKFFSNPKNFTPEQWRILVEYRAELEKKLEPVLGKKIAKAKKDVDESKQTKARKGKTLGARRNWIPM